MRVIIDTDPGIDDSVALALAVRSPELEIAAITTTYGNTTVTHATRNARELLTRLGVGERIPVHPGADRPLLRPLRVADETHGRYGVGYAEVEVADEESLLPIEAPGMLLQAAANADTPLTVICLGPLTNLALALALDRPLLQAQVAEIVLMGGEPDGQGNVTPVAEFNFWCDPEAAEMVMQSGIPLRMVGLNVTRRMILSRQAVDLLGAHDDPELRWWSDMLRFYEEFHRAQSGLTGCVINDPLAIALAMRPEWGVTRAMAVEVARHDDATRGQSLCDRHQLSARAVNAQVYLDCRWADVMQLVNDRVFHAALSVEELSRGLAMRLL